MNWTLWNKPSIPLPPKPKAPKRAGRPEVEKWWTTIYYGARGSGKTLHQAKVCLKIFKYLDWLYFKNPTLNQAIVYSIQKFSPAIEEKYLGTRLFYWNEGKDLRYCPRKTCWKGTKKHRLHGCYLIFDDIATILPAGNWQNTPTWLVKIFSQGRHFGIRILANMQDPFSVDVNFRRYTDMAYRFKKLVGSPDPDETKKPVKRIWGIYLRRRINAGLLWKFGDMTEEEIQVIRAKEEQQKDVDGTKFVSVLGDAWRGSYHWIGRKTCEIYDTTQDVPEYVPAGFEHHELFCIDKRHNHTDKTAPNYCNYKKVSHSIV